MSDSYTDTMVLHKLLSEAREKFISLSPFELEEDDSCEFCDGTHPDHRLDCKLADYSEGVALLERALHDLDSKSRLREEVVEECPALVALMGEDEAVRVVGGARQLPPHQVSQAEVFLEWRGTEVHIPKGHPNYDAARHAVYRMNWDEVLRLATS